MSNIRDKTGRVKDSVSYKITNEDGSVSDGKQKTLLKCVIPTCNKDATHRCIGKFLYCKKHLDDVRMFFDKSAIEEL